MRVDAGAVTGGGGMTRDGFEGDLSIDTGVMTAAATARDGIDEG